MTTTQSQQQNYTLVVGLGVTGLSVVRYLSSLGEPLVVVDSRDIPPGLSELRQQYSDVPFHGGAFDRKLFKAARRIVLSPGVPLADEAVQAASSEGVLITGDLDLFAQVVNAPVIGITGSNGKSTVTALLTAMAEQDGKRAVMAGNIGKPVLDAVDEAAELYVVELSSFQLDTLQQLPMLASVVLNISEDHMDRYADLAAYAVSKHAIYQQAEHCVVNLDDELARGTSCDPAQTTGFTLAEPGENAFGIVERDRKRHVAFGKEALIAVDDIRIRGDHNIANALAALALGSYVGLSMHAMLEALRRFPGLRHRTQWVAEVDGVNWYNDSKATNVGAAIAAITGLPGKHVLIAGGEGKDADFSELAPVAAKHLVAAVLIGKDAHEIEQVIGDAVPCSHADDMQQAVSMARELSADADNVLLSPACASLDMFTNFEQRGDVFVKAVRGLAS